MLGPHGLVDTMEVSGTWTNLRSLYHSMKDALSREADFVGCHISHAAGDPGNLQQGKKDAAAGERQQRCFSCLSIAHPAESNPTQDSQL
jgi:hypothetical protein